MFYFCPSVCLCHLSDLENWQVAVYDVSTDESILSTCSVYQSVCRSVLSVSVCLSPSTHLYLAVCLSAYLSVLTLPMHSSISRDLSVCLLIYLPIYLSVCLSTYLCYQSVHPLIYIQGSVCLSAYLLSISGHPLIYIYVSIRLCPSIHPSTYLYIYHILHIQVPETYSFIHQHIYISIIFYIYSCQKLIHSFQPPALV